MNHNDTNENNRARIHLDELPASEIPSGAQHLPGVTPTVGPEPEPPAEPIPVSEFATRAGSKDGDGPSRQEMILIGGGLAAAVLFFIFTAVLGHSPAKQHTGKQPTNQTQSQKQPLPKGSVTPLIDAVHNPAQDNTNGQLGPGDIKRTRSTENPATKSTGSASGNRPSAVKPGAGTSLASVPSFSDTQQKWEEPRPYGEAPATPVLQNQKLASLKEPSLVFVRSVAQVSSGPTRPEFNDGDGPLLDLAPGTRIRAKLQTAVSTAVQDTVVAEVEYTYAIGDKIVIPAGTKVYGKLIQADRNGYMNIKFDELEMLDRPPEKIEAIATGLDLGPLKGAVTGKNTGKNLLVKSISGIGSTLAMVAGNNTGSSFSEDDLIRERLAENIGTAGDSDIMSMAINSRVVVSTPADTKIYVVFTKHEQSAATLHKVPSTNP
jgi:hypothetical protein